MAATILPAISAISLWVEAPGRLEPRLPYDSLVHSRRVWLGRHVDSHQPACFGSSALPFPGQVIVSKLPNWYEPPVPHPYNRAHVNTHFCLLALH